MRTEICYEAGPAYDPTSTGCPKCKATKETRILWDIEEVLERAGLRVVDAESGSEGSRLIAQDGHLRWKSHSSDHLQESAMERDGDQTLDLPAFKFSYRGRSRTVEVFPYLDKEVGLSPWDAVKSRPWYVKRLIAIEALSFYAHSHYTGSIAGDYVEALQPSLEPDVFQKQGWVDVFLEVKE